MNSMILLYILSFQKEIWPQGTYWNTPIFDGYCEKCLPLIYKRQNVIRNFAPLTSVQLSPLILTSAPVWHDQYFGQYHLRLWNWSPEPSKDEPRLNWGHGMIIIVSCLTKDKVGGNLQCTGRQSPTTKGSPFPKNAPPKKAKTLKTWQIEIFSTQKLSRMERLHCHIIVDTIWIYGWQNMYVCVGGGWVAKFVKFLSKICLLGPLG